MNPSQFYVENEIVKEKEHFLQKNAKVIIMAIRVLLVCFYLLAKESLPSLSLSPDNSSFFEIVGINDPAS